MRTIRRSTTRLVLVVLTILILAACASGGASLSTVGRPVDGGPPAGGQTDGQTVGEVPGGAPDPGTGQPGDGVGAPVDDARIVRTGTIDLEVTDVPVALRTARDAIRALGGYIGASQTRNDGDTPVASITYRIPADRWEDALDVLRGLNGLTTKVVAEQTDAVEVTGQVLDLEARIKNLRSSEAALQVIAANAVKISDVLEVQNQLTQVRGQIESLTAALTDLEDRASFATLTASFTVPVVAVEIAQQGWDPKVVVDEASASLINVLQGLTSAGIWFAIVWLPILLVVGVFIGIGVFVARRLGSRAGRGGAGPGPASEVVAS
ncbi:MAG TPA: DUF4349 domain-containing protein [Candidatus Saccharimonadales bacterium]|nr:DUF4349 domain-containing protein [Candidatus Saccharimonadales bacterium]